MSYLLTGVAEVDTQWANIWPCSNNTNEVFTCGNPGWASTVCSANLANFTWASSYITVPRLNLSTPQIETAGTNKTVMRENRIPLGVGLGIGLGLPLICASVIFAFSYVRAQKKIRNLEKMLRDEQSKSAASCNVLDLNIYQPGGVSQNRPRELSSGDSRQELA